MPLPSLNLDDRTFDELVEEALSRVRQTCPAWTDLSTGDPGRVLLELFAHLTEVMIYRLNRLPEKAYYEFLSLMGVRLQPPAAAVATLRFGRRGAGQEAIDIPAGTRVGVGRSGGAGEVPVFVTRQHATLPRGEPWVEVAANHCERVEGELVGLGTGLAGLALQLRRGPVIAPTGDGLDLVVGVEAGPGELGERVPALEYAGKTYRIWSEVDSFAGLGQDRYVYVADRYSGQIAFGPAARVAAAADGNLEDLPRALAEIPPAGREIRAWYRRGGGPAGNVPAGALTVLKDPLSGVEVTNPAPAGGGRAAESLENALVRGPQAIHGLERAITARDFEGLALHASGLVARARAIAPADLWKYAQPGAVEVLLVPYLPEEQCGPGRVTADALEEQQNEAARRQIADALEERRPLGVRCTVRWADTKAVSVTARAVVRREENQAAVRQRVLARLHGYISPLPVLPYNPTGWRFGQSLHASHVYDAALAEPGVLWVDRVRLRVDEVPNGLIRALAADYFQPNTWYAGSGDTLFRTLDDGEGWEPAARFRGEEIMLVRANPDPAGKGHVVAVGQPKDEAGQSRVHLTRDCGESWDQVPTTTAFKVNAIDWTVRNGAPVLLLATDVGLYELALAGGTPVQVLVDPSNQGLGFYAVAVAYGLHGQVSVAVAAREQGGVWLSAGGGAPGTFKYIGLKGKDVQLLAVQHHGVRSFLWAGVYAAGTTRGEGCYRRELLGSEEPRPEDWREMVKDWDGGSCRALAFVGTQGLAATYRAGVLQIDAAAPDPKWTAPGARSGLPLGDAGTFVPVRAVAAAANVIMAGTGEGVYRSQDSGATYESASAQVFTDKVTLPPTWLFCSGTHEIEVVSEDEVERD